MNTLPLQQRVRHYTCLHTSTKMVVETHFTSLQSGPGFQSHWSPLLSHPSASESRKTQRKRLISTKADKKQAQIYTFDFNVISDSLHKPLTNTLRQSLLPGQTRSTDMIHSLSFQLILQQELCGTVAEDPLWELQHLFWGQSRPPFHCTDPDLTVYSPWHPPSVWESRWWGDGNMQDQRLAS